MKKPIKIVSETEDSVEFSNGDKIRYRRSWREWFILTKKDADYAKAVYKRTNGFVETHMACRFLKVNNKKEALEKYYTTYGNKEKP